jgi:tetratricopeptide (TPR) repeat protein
MARIVRALLAVVVLAAGAHRASADNSRARQLFAEGQAAFSAGRFSEAAQLFERAYADSKATRLIWNIAQAYRRQYEVDRDLANLRRARALFHNFGEIAETEAERGEARAAEQRAATEIEAAEQRARPAPTPAPSLVAPASERPSRVPAFALLGTGAGLALAGLGFGIGAHDEANTVQAAGKPAPVPFSTVANHESLGQAYQIVSYALYGVGAAAALGGVVLAIIRPGSARRHALVTPTAGGATVGVSF